MNNLQIISTIIGVILIGVVCKNIPKILKDKKIDMDEWKEIGDMAVETIKIGLSMSKITTKDELQDFTVEKLSEELTKNKVKVNKNEIRMIVAFLIHGMEKSVL